MGSCWPGLRILLVGGICAELGEFHGVVVAMCAELAEFASLSVAFVGEIAGSGWVASYRHYDNRTVLISCHSTVDVAINQHWDTYPAVAWHNNYLKRDANPIDLAMKNKEGGEGGIDAIDFGGDRIDAMDCSNSKINAIETTGSVLGIVLNCDPICKNPT